MTRPCEDGRGQEWRKGGHSVLAYDRRDVGGVERGQNINYEKEDVIQHLLLQGWKVHDL